MCEPSDDVVVPAPQVEVPTNEAGKVRGTVFPVQSVIALVVSSGVVAVVGPLLGQMYWDGYLSPFGLSSQEFPASDAEIRSYAFISIASAAYSIWTGTLRLWWETSAMAILFGAFVACSGSKPARIVRYSIRRWFLRVLHGRTMVWRIARGAGYALLHGVSQLAVIAMLACAVTVVCIPLFARRAGTSEGRKDLARMSGAKAPRGCDAIRSMTSYVCPHIVVFGKDAIAVIDAGKIYRESRASLNLVTPLPAP